MIVVIDGPAGSGKSSTSKKLAEIHHLNVLDSGAFYRACTLIGRDAGSFEAELLLEQIQKRKLTFELEGAEIKILIDGKVTKNELRSPEVNAKVSVVAKKDKIRDWVNTQMREIVKEGRFIADGRDLGTVVFPNADLKIWLIASAEVRAKRRLMEQEQQGFHDSDYEEVLKNILERDQIDSQRATAPLKKADDAIEVDTSKLNFDEQVLLISSYISKLSS